MRSPVPRAAAGATLFLALGWLWHIVPPAGAIDFYNDYAHARIAGRAYPPDVYDPMAQREMGEELYARALTGRSATQLFDATQRRGLDSTATPLLYTAFAWLPCDYDLALALFRILLLGAFAGGVLLLGRAAKLGWTPSLLLAAAFVRWYTPLHMDVFVGNVGGFQLLGLALFLALTGRFPATAAAILTLVVGFKPNIVPIVILLVVARIVTRDFVRLRREALAAACAAAFGFAVSSLHYRSPWIWYDWLDAVRDFHTRLPGREWNNVAPALPLYERYGPNASYAVALALLLLAAGVLVWRRRREDGLVVALGIAVFLLSEPTVWVQYLVLAIPAAFGVLMTLRRANA
jgi:hypothetical protein